MNYNDIQGWFTWPDLYRRMAEQVRPDGTIIELGVWKGRSIAYLGEQLVRLDKPSVKLIGIDRFDASGWDGYARIRQLDREQRRDRLDLLHLARTNLANCGLAFIELIQSDCIEAAALFDDASLDFLFVDDNHNPEHVARELQAWLPKLRRPTWIAGDDYQQVRPAVQAVLANHHTELGCWVADLP